MSGKRYGRFDNDAREYVITDPMTPMPWMNYLFNDDYYALISATGGGYSFHKDARNRRILRYRPNDLPTDRPGRYVYIRRKDNGAYWAANWAPVRWPLGEGDFESRHGFGYTSIKYRCQGIESVLAFTVPMSDNCELWNLKLTNTTSARVEFDVFPYAEFSYWEALCDISAFQMTYFFVDVRPVGKIIERRAADAVFNIVAAFGCSADWAGIDCDREAFMGPGRDHDDPLVVEQGRCLNSICDLGNPIAAMQVPVVLEPGETKEVGFVLAVDERMDTARELIAKYLAPGMFEKTLAAVKGKWSNILSSQLVQTPDLDTNLCLNTWHAYQAQVTFRVSRGPSIYEGGIGRGMGFRDSCQDCLGVTHSERGRVRKLLCDLASNLYEDGKSKTQFFRLSKEGQYDGCNDTHLWFIMAAAAYLKDSGDFSLLEEQLPYVEGSKDSFLQHMDQTLGFTRSHLGPHGLPLIGKCDWNDVLRAGRERGESVMIAFQYIIGLREMIALAEHLGRADDASRYRQWLDEAVAAIDQHCWDGDWFVRAFGDDGQAIGRKADTLGKLFLNAQTWAVMSGVAGQQRGEAAMDSVARHLDGPYGIAKLWPAYRGWDPRLRELSVLNTGTKENGGIFSHANTWAIIAECMLGRGDRAYKYYSQLRPTEKDKIQHIHEAEPYVYAQAIAGPEHRRHGTARNSWLTGAVAWMYVAATQYILGLRPTWDGLKIDPCIPADWDGFEVKRRFRDGTYCVRVENPDHVSCGVTSMEIEGKPVADNVLPPPEPGRIINARVVLGKGGRR